MFLKCKRFFKQRRRSTSAFKFSNKNICLSVLKFKPSIFKTLFKKLLKLTKKLKFKVFFSFKKNLIQSRKSKNSRMGKGKGQNTYTFSYSNNKFLFLENFPNSRFSKLKRSINFFYKNKIVKMFCTFKATTFILSNTVVSILFILLGGVIPLIERKVLSLTHRRIGPKFVGFKGRFQFIADAVKLLIKEFFLPKNTNKFFFFIAPIFILNVNLFLILNMVWFYNVSLNISEYTLLYVLIVETLTNVLLFYVGFFVKNKYTFISSSRLFNTVFISEIITSLFFLLIYFFFKNFFIGSYLTKNSNLFSFINVFLILPFLTFIFLLLIKKTPFDFVEAETEIIMGYHVEHSGFLAGALILIEYLHLFFWIYFFISVFVL